MVVPRSEAGDHAADEQPKEHERAAHQDLVVRGACCRADARAATTVSATTSTPPVKPPNSRRRFSTISACSGVMGTASSVWIGPRPSTRPAGFEPAPPPDEHGLPP